MQLYRQKTILNNEALGGKCWQMIKIGKRLSLKHHVIMGIYYTKDVPVHAIMAYGAKVQLHSFSTSATDGGKANFTTGR
jgi:hypothetical protein